MIRIRQSRYGVRKPVIVVVSPPPRTPSQVKIAGRGLQTGDGYMGFAGNIEGLYMRNGCVDCVPVAPMHQLLSYRIN